MELVTEMKKTLAVSAALLLIAAFPMQAVASTSMFSFDGAGVSGTLRLTYGAAADAKYPQAFEVTGISGTFSDSNNGLNIVNASVGSLVPITRDMPESTNLLAPNDFSRFAVTAGLPHGFLSYDNLLYPGGSPQTASDYPVHGGLLDIYGLMFNIGGGRVVNLWSNGDFSAAGTGPVDYGAAVATRAVSLDYVAGGVAVAAVPEPETYALVLAALAGLGVTARRRKSL